jgi:hypothetical protein
MEIEMYHFVRCQEVPCFPFFTYLKMGKQNLTILPQPNYVLSCFIILSQVASFPICISQKGEKNPK